MYLWLHHKLSGFNFGTILDTPPKIPMFMICGCLYQVADERISFASGFRPHCFIRHTVDFHTQKSGIQAVSSKGMTFFSGFSFLDVDQKEHRFLLEWDGNSIKKHGFDYFFETGRYDL